MRAIEIERSDLARVALWRASNGRAQPYIVLAHDGLGSPPLERIRTRGYLQDGETDWGATLRPRRWTLTLLVQAHGALTLEQARDQLMRWLLPRRETRFYFQRDDGTWRYLDAALTDAISAPSAERWGDAQRIALQLEAADPLLRAITTTQLAWIGAAPGAVIPMAIPLKIGSGALAATQAWQSESTYPAPVEIELVGPCTGAAITLNSETLTLPSVQAGRRVIVDTRWGRSRISEYEGATYIRELLGEAGGSLELRVQPGGNQILINLTGGSASSAVYLRWQETFISL